MYNDEEGCEFKMKENCLFSRVLQLILPQTYNSLRFYLGFLLSRSLRFTVVYHCILWYDYLVR